MRTFDKLARSLSVRKVLAILSVVVVIHLIAMSFYINQNSLARRTANRDAVIQKIINIIHLLEATPTPDRAKAISAMNDPDLQASITKKPQYELRFETISFWQISQELRKQAASFEVSIELTKDQWLNIQATFYTHFLLMQLIFFGFEVIILATIVIVAWSINRFTRPIESFKKAVERFGADLNTQLVPIDGPSVVQEAARAMNEMQQRISELIRDRTQMLAAISHDLRTPITRMKLRAQFIDHPETKQSLIIDLEEMETMINETLFFAREDAMNEERIHLDLVSLLDSICNSMADMGHEVVFKSKQHRIPFLGRPTALKRAFTNVINNAVRYAKNVRVHIQEQHKTIVIKVEDRGPGINEKELKHVFEPFYRGEHSRSRDTGGVGLGLAVTRDIIRAHEGKIYLRNRHPHGLCATIELVTSLT